MSNQNALFAKPPAIYPKRVWGRYRKLKWVAMVVLLSIYYLAPFLRYNRGVNAPDQAILIDMPVRRAYFFGIEIWPHELYYVAGILVLAAIGLFFVSAILGRVWCGYACPQTVWTDLFIWVERIVQGDRNARMKLDKSSWGVGKIFKKGLTHLIWLLIGVLTGGAWVLYFNDAPTLLRDAYQLHISTTVLLWIVGLTFSTYVMAGFAREQVCSHMCPYARFQSAMFDKDTLIIAYDQDRGEPRGNYKAGASRTGLGDCIDCGNCVTVCPTGIDIRNGLQMECIACGMCVDACNNVMDKIGLPRGLIRYDTESNYEARTTAKDCGKDFKTTIRLMRPRTIYYSVILSAVGGLMLFSLFTRSPLDIHITHDRNPLFVRLTNGDTRNNYTINIMNMTDDPHNYALTVNGINATDIKIGGPGHLVASDLHVPSDSEAEYRVMLSARDVKSAHTDITFELKDNATGKVAKHTSLFINGE